MRSQAWYQAKLVRYFMTHYEEFEPTTEFYPDPSENQWLFYSPELAVKIKLTVYDDGRITEFRYRRGVENHETN